MEQNNQFENKFSYSHDIVCVALVSEWPSYSIFFIDYYLVLHFVVGTIENKNGKNI